MEKIKCQICGKEINRLGQHLNYNHSEISQEEYYRRYLLKNDKENICPVCGKPTVFLGLTKGYRRHCSTRCSTLDPDVKDKLKTTNIERYGVINVFLLPEVQEKAHMATSTVEALEKRKHTNLINRGVEFPAQSKEVNEKLKHTSLEKYGTEYPSQSKIVKDKVANTCMERYGVKCNFASKDPKLNGRQYFTDNFGVTNSMQLRETHVKLAQTLASNIADDGTPLNSSWEVKVWNFCRDNNLTIERNIPFKYSRDGKEHTTFIDFKIENKLYEVKGNHILEGYYDKISCPIDIKLKIYRENDVTIICKNIKKYIDDEKFKDLKFLDLDNLEVIIND